MDEFRFDPEKHEYWLGRRKLPSVTQIIDYHGLVSDFAKNEERAQEGAYAHEACRYLFESRLDWASVDDRIRGHCESLLRFIEITGFKAEACEVRKYHSFLLFAGSFDVIGTMPDGSRLLIDLKTGAEEPWHKYQTAGYMILEGGYRRRGCLYLQKGGAVARFDEHTDQTDEMNFISLLNVYRIKEKAHA